MFTTNVLGGKRGGLSGGPIEEAVIVCLFLFFIPPQKNRYWEAREGSVVGAIEEAVRMGYTSVDLADV